MWSESAGGTGFAQRDDIGEMECKAGGAWIGQQSCGRIVEFPRGGSLSAVGIVLLLLTFIKVPIDLVPQNGGSTVSSKERKSGWTAEWGMQQIQVRGKKAVRFTETGSGRMSAFPEEVRWHVEATWQSDDRFLPLETERTV